MEIPKRTNYNYINLDAFLYSVEDKYGISDELSKEISDYVSGAIEQSISKERAAWLGRALKDFT